MQISRKYFKTTLGGLSFILLFSLFPFYHDLVARGMVPAFFGGWFGPWAVIVLCLLLIPTTNVILEMLLLKNVFVAIFAATILYLFLVISCNLAFATNAYLSVSVMQSVSTVFLWLTLVSLAIFLPIESNGLRMAVWSFFFFSLLFLIKFILETGSVMYISASLFSDEGVATYQGFARSALAMVFFLLACSQNLSVRAFLFFSGAFVLFVLAARSEFVAFLFSAIVFEFLRSRLSIGYSIFWALLSSGIILTTIFFWDKLLRSRHGELLDLSSSRSWDLRTFGLHRAMQTITENPFLGSFGSHILDNGESGLYAHNILSAWANYGLFGFLFVFLLCIWATAGSAAAVRRFNGELAIANYSFLFNFCVLFLLLISKSIFWIVPGLAWGLYISLEFHLLRKSGFS
mgnify:CR=1 FL=1